MQNEKSAVITGALIHDMGKLLFRYNDGRNHSLSGYEYMKDEIGISDEKILEQIEFHHSSYLRNASIKNDSLAYITCIADNIASGADRRDKEDPDLGFEKEMQLESVFNILNNNKENKKYAPKTMEDMGEINYPSEEKKQFDETEYGKIVDNIKYGLKGIDNTPEYANSLLEIMEGNLSFVPSSTSKKQVADISLFDHLKITSALATCMYDYFSEEGINDYKTELFEKSDEFYKKKAFMIYSMDISGIQNFIYSVAPDNALKALRARSFYLEVMMEHLADELLISLELSRANLIYTGGGHCYLLIPNTNGVKKTISEFEGKIRNWFIETFNISLYVAFGSKECSANDLTNKPQGSYREIFKDVSAKISESKRRKYNEKEIEYLNSRTKVDQERECRICGRVSLLEGENICQICNGIIEMSPKILTEDFVVIVDEKPEEVSLPLPNDKYMIMEKRDELEHRMKTDNSYLRAYGKNKMFSGMQMATKLWVGDYRKGTTFEELASASTGVEHLGVLRADVDNLGTAFVSGFEREEQGDMYVSISRTATFSRRMSMFFKLHINSILRNGEFSISKKGEIIERNALIVYSGGDDLFIIGAWDDIVEAAVDLNHAFRKYSQNTLSLSAGIGMVPQKYPVSAMARQSGELEEESKNSDGKNSIAFFDTGNCFKWDVFENKVVKEKLELIKKYFEKNDGKGTSAIYNMLKLLRNRKEKINLARFAYFLGRLEPAENANEEIKVLFKEFSTTMYKWMQDEEESRQLILAIYLYVYLSREKEDKKWK